MSIVQIIDENILIWIENNIRIDVLNPIIKAFTSLGNMGLIWIIVAIILLCNKSTRKIGVYTTLAIFFSIIATNLTLKLIIQRPRPYVTMNNFIPLLYSSDPNSFPSGHTSTAFAAGIVWLKLISVKSLKAVAVVQALLMGLSRMYVGVHYPSDVLMGALVGTLCAVIALKVEKLAQKNKII